MTDEAKKDEVQYEHANVPAGELVGFSLEKPVVPSSAELADSEDPDEASVLVEDDSDTSSRHDLTIPDPLPIMGLDNFVLYPFMIAPMIVGLEHSKQLVNDALRGEKLVGIFLKKNANEPESFDNLYQVGTLAVILKMLRMPDGSIRLLLHGVERIRIENQVAETPYLSAKVERLNEINAEARATQAMMKTIQSQMQRISQMGHLSEDLTSAVLEMHDAGKLADLAISNIQVKVEERQEVLETADVEKRLERVVEILGREIELFQLGSEIQNKVATKLDKHQRDYMLREQIKTIRKELGEDDESVDVEELRAAVEAADLPEHARKVADKELSRLKSMHPSSPEYSVSRSYLDWIVSLPWSASTPDDIQIDAAKKILDEDHYGLIDVKERILEYLSVIKLKKQIRGPILCFVGPPGVGKTSLGRSIARSLGRKFYRMSVGGMRDEAEIRGHRRTYIGSLPGRIIKALKDCGANNPLIMIDEIDKIGNDFRGDPASALLEVLDPEQNFSFTDHYMDMPFDLSKVMFITTANVLDPIPSPLRDRMEILRLSGYTMREKNEIARRYLIPRSYDNTGVEKKHIRFGDESLMRIIEGYTSEAGVRSLEREIGNICRKVARNVAQGKYQNVSLRGNDVEAYLGPQRYFHETVNRTCYPGVSTGMAWTQTGGELLFIEATSVPGNGQLLLTGQLGDVMKESAMAGLNYLHSCAESFGIPGEAFMKRNFHLHVPAGATPKDGPSAGVAMAAAFYSLLVNQPVKEKLAMTGEITLKGNVLMVGGLKEKILAAHRAGIKEIILPSRSEAELKKEVPEEVRKSVHFYFVDHVVDALKIAFPGKTFDNVGVPMPPQQAQEQAPEQPQERQQRPGRHDRHRPQDQRRQELPPPVAAEPPVAATPDDGPQDPPVITPPIDWDAIDETKMEAGPANLHIEIGPSRPMLRIDPEHGKKDLHHHHKPRVSPAFLEELEEAAVTAAEEANAPAPVATETESAQEGAKRRRGGRDRHRSRRGHGTAGKTEESGATTEIESAATTEKPVEAPVVREVVAPPVVPAPEVFAPSVSRPAFKPFVPEPSSALLVKPEPQQPEAPEAEPTATDTEKPTEKPRRGRGRPAATRRPKVVESEEPPLVVKPAKPIPVETPITEAAPAAPKRRGRPAKPKVVEAPAEEPVADVAEKPAPKRRGRPAKAKTEE